MAKKFYITAAIPYVNAAPHIGHALEFVQADVIARYHRLLGEKTLFLTGADENSLKNVRAAEDLGISTKKLCDQNSKKFENLKEGLNVSFDIFQRGTDKKGHWTGAQKLWKKIDKAGDIYKGKYEGLYCVNCEAYYTEKDLVNGLCPEHKKRPEWVKEENYFFKLSKYQKQLKKLIETNKLKIIPETRRNETLAFINQGLEDFSLSRSQERAKNWGVPVPGDDSQIMYVWFDALGIYLTGIGYGWDQALFKKWWPAEVHVIGKGINRFHTIYWPAMLLSAGLDLPKEIFIHGYVTVEGEKISKSLGNVVDPFELARKYGIDPVRYYLLKEIPAYGDGDFSIQRFKEVYNADLANGLGNLVARIAKLASQANIKYQISNIKITDKKFQNYHQFLKKYQFNDTLAFIWGKISQADKYVDSRHPWNLKGEELEKVLDYLVKEVQKIALLIEPFLPETAEKIQKQFKGPKIKAGEPLFPRLE
jgi:methionyl-tRNA synthetase